MEKISFGPAKISDALRISILFKQVYLQTYGLEGITFEFTNFITERFAPQHIEQIIQSNPDQLLIAYFDDNPIGAAEIHLEATCPIRDVPAPELDKLYVLERFYGRGIGYGLINEAERIVKAKGQDQFWLAVYEGNQRAISFYKRQGYEVIGETDFVLQDNTYLNKVMSKKLS